MFLRKSKFLVKWNKLSDFGFAIDFCSLVIKTNSLLLTAGKVDGKIVSRHPTG